MSSTVETFLSSGNQARRDGRLGDAKDLFAEAVNLCREGDDRPLLAEALTGLGQIERDLQDAEAALGRYEEAVAIYRQLDEPLRLAHTIRHVADILRNLRRLELTETAYAEALAIYCSHAAETPALDLANALRGYALLKADSGDRAASADLWQRAGLLYAQTGVQAGVDESQRQIAQLTV